MHKLKIIIIITWKLLTTGNEAAARPAKAIRRIAWKKLQNLVYNNGKKKKGMWGKNIKKYQSRVQ